MLLATSGHVDHGKTTLIRSLTGVDCDRLEEERRRGITIVLGYAPLVLPSGRSLSVVDVPGHSKLVKTMLSGIGHIDLTLTAISARSGVMPQTREHLNAARLLGVRDGIVALTFADLVEDIQQAQTLVRSQLQGTLLENAPIIPVSAPTGMGCDALVSAIEERAHALPEESQDELPCCMAVDRIFSQDGYGTVVTGTLARGQIKIGDHLDALPGPTGIRVKGIQVHGRSIDAVRCGQRVALNLAIDRHILPGRCLLVAPGSIKSGRVFDCHLSWLPHAKKPLTRSRSASIHLGGATASADVHADGEIKPGQMGVGRIRLDRTLPLPPGARFVLRAEPINGYGGVIGGGVVLDPSPPRRRAAEYRQRRAEASTTEAVELLVRLAGKTGIEIEELARRTLLPWPTTNHRRFAPEVVELETLRIKEVIEAFHLEHPLEIGAPQHLVGTSQLARLALNTLVSEGIVAKRNGHLAQSGHRVSLDPAREALAKKIMRTVGRAGLQGPSEAELLERYPAGAHAVREVIIHLERTGRLVRVSGFCFPGREVMQLRHRAAVAVTLKQELPVSWLKEHASLSRKFAIPLWRWLDSTGTTIRRGDVRVAGPRAVEYANEQ